jgi:hypothetical protein
VSHEEGDMHPSPFFYQPDPQKRLFVPAKAEKLVRRSPREYFLVGRKPDGREVEVRLTAGAFRIQGI